MISGNSLDPDGKFTVCKSKKWSGNKYCLTGPSHFFRCLENKSLGCLPNRNLIRKTPRPWCDLVEQTLSDNLIIQTGKCLKRKDQVLGVASVPYQAQKEETFLNLILMTSFQCANWTVIQKELLSHGAITLFEMLGEQVFKLSHK